ncbi:thiosulfohydrolase SoxB [Roseospira marina]|uniref:Thiosulfohydrolase SoxB n=1 Tax=Roseospira marina TaxID=140057 RepID=A0A5M6IEH7_9PROT|nr:thiosulfohydrolase SoxB [Roseospira marina]KAA5606654.1 thiosulfohydrolase SoxB [Roseospira marina]MBB4313939.1 sulfur-oxidizing protein SoxB [Roseospira marina]MBB5087101.1 sulfur-oxidizing protein SoxB [Roseospira marina]
MFTRRDFLRTTAATAILMGSPLALRRAAAQQTLSQDDLLRFDPLGQVTLLHVTDVHAQLRPLYFREPSVNLGVGAVAGDPPHITGRDFLARYDIPADSPECYALTSVDFTALARTYGRVGGLDRLATLVNAIRAERPDQTLFLDGGDTWQGSYTSLQTNGADMIRAFNALKTDAMTAHWEFTYGEARVRAAVEGELDFPFLCGNVIDATWEEPVFESTQMFERGGVAVAVIGQAFPYTPIANPRHLIPEWSFGIRPEMVQEHVDNARANGAEVVVLLSHNGFDVDRKLASLVNGIDVILTGHTHDALPREVTVGKTLLIASGSHGKFLSRLDLEVKDGRVTDYRYRLIPVFSDVITPDPEMAKVITEVRAPYEAECTRVLGQTDDLLYRRGNFNGSFDDLICQALLAERDAEIALSPGFRWGATLLPGQDITVDDVYSMTSITYPNAYRQPMTGAMLKTVLEDVADNLFNTDPFYQQGGDMVRVGGMGYAIDIHKPMGERISDLTLLATGDPIDPAREYIVAGWASVNEGTEGPPIYDIVSQYIERQGTVSVPENTAITIKA